MSRDIDNTQDVLDSREIIERIEEMIADLMDEEMNGYLPDASDEEKAEFEALRALHNEGKNYSDDWEYGATLIRDTYFREYAMELAEELDLIPKTYTWPASCIDWDQAARELQMDYSSIDFGGVTYWVR